MNFDRFHATQVEESHNHGLFFECKRRHFSIKNITATRPRHKHSTGSTVLPFSLAQPKEQSRLLRQLPRFYLLPFPRKKLGYLRTWTPHVLLGKVPLPIYRRLGGPRDVSGWAREVPPPPTTVVRTPNLPAHSQSLYQLHYPGQLHGFSWQSLMQCRHETF